MTLRFSLALVFLSFALPASGQTPGSCATGQASAELSLSDVRARIDNTGGLFWRGADPVYQVPKAGGASAVFAAGLWLGGTVDGALRTAAATYGDWEFWPGPLDDEAALPDPADCSAYDRVYRVSLPDLASYAAGNPPSADLAAWPVGLGAPAVDTKGLPVVPTSRDQVIDLEADEIPVIFGTETAFWVMNDVGNAHASTGSAPLGVEVRASAFSIYRPDVPALHQATVYRYEITNRNAAPIEDLHLGFWVDHDLGDSTDDYVGTDAGRAMYYAYNADDLDGGADGYGAAPPALGAVLLNGASHSITYVGGDDPTNGPPDSAPDVYNYLRAQFRTGAPLTRPDGSLTPWIYDGDAAAQTYWSETDADPAAGLQPNVPGDRRGVISTGPLTLASGETTLLDVALVYGRGADHLASVVELRSAADLVQARYDDGSLFDPVGGGLGLPPASAPVLLSPTDGTTFAPPAAVLLDWEPVDGADGYRIELATTETFSDVRVRTDALPPYRVDFRDLPEGSFTPVYWRITAVNAAGTGPTSETRSFWYPYSVIPGVAELSNGAPAFLEIVGPGGFPPCGGGAVSTFGCSEAGGNAVYSEDDFAPLDANSTNQYTITNRGSFTSALSRVAPREIEIRFTDGGSIASHAFGEDDSGANTTHRVPFEVWDIGVVPFGRFGTPTENDPTDDVRLVPVLFSDDGGNGRGTCLFEFGELEANGNGNPIGRPLTDRIYGVYPATTYEAFEAAAAPLVDAAPGGCYFDDGTLMEGIDTSERVFERIVIGDLQGNSSVSSLNGAVIRFHTTDPRPVADEPVPEEASLALSVVPNPSRGAATVRFAMDAPGVVRVRVVDVLGREVAVLTEGERPAGSHELALPPALPSGVYVVALDVPGERLARTFTVVR